MTEDSAGPDRDQPPAEDGQAQAGHRTAGPLLRMREGRIAAGVCAGLGRYTGIDPVIFRIGFALLVVANGQGILLYIAAALLMAEDPGALSVGEQVLKRKFDGGTVLVILGALLGLGVLISAAGNGLSGGALTVVTVFALVLLVAHGRKVNFADVFRTLPERLQGYPPGSYGTSPSGSSAGRPVSFQKSAPLPEGMIDLATLGARGRGTHVPSAPPPAARPPAPKPHRTKSVLTPVTLLLAMIAVAAMYPVAIGHPANNAVQVGAATGLAVIGLGLVVASVFGRGRGLVACGTVLSLGLMTTSVIAEAPVNGRFGDVEWRPIDATQTEQSYRMVVGGGELDLTALPLAPGQRMRVNVDVTVGQMRVTVPRTARVELDLRLMLGDATVDRRVVSGPNAKVVEVLEPEGLPKQAPTIELHVRGKLGDLEVTRA